MPPSVNRRIGRAAMIVSIGVLLSRLLGFVREMVFAGILGANAQSDEYFVAFLIPDFLNYLLAGAFLTITFVPIFMRHLAAEDEAEAWRAFSAIVRLLAVGMIALVAVAMLLAPHVITLIEPGFTAEQVVRATRLTRIVLPAQIFFVTGSMLMAVQYAKEQFVIPTLAPIIYNVGIIAGGLLLGYFADLQVEGFAWGVLAGAFVGNFAVQVWGARRAGMRLDFRVPWFHPALVEYLKLAIPLMLGQSVVVLDEQLGRSFGSLAEDGAVSWLNYARRVMLVPAGVIAQAAGVAAYPYLARLVEEGKLREVADTVANALRYVLFLSLPAAVILALVSEPAIALLFQRGQFGVDDTRATAAALVFYAFAIPLWGIAQLVNRGFYARRQMWTVVIVGTAGTLAAIPLYYVLLGAMGHPGLALASTLALALYCTALLVIWAVRTSAAPLRVLVGSVLRSLAATAAAAGAFWGVSALLSESLLDRGWIWTVVYLVVMGITFALAFGGVILLLRSEELTAMLARLRRRST